jgi:hypothetical protein
LIAVNGVSTAVSLANTSMSDMSVFSSQKGQSKAIAVAAPCTDSDFCTRIQLARVNLLVEGATESIALNAACGTGIVIADSSLAATGTQKASAVYSEPDAYSLTAQNSFFSATSNGLATGISSGSNVDLKSSVIHATGGSAGANGLRSGNAEDGYFFGVDGGEIIATTANGPAGSVVCTGDHCNIDIGGTIVKAKGAPTLETFGVFSFAALGSNTSITNSEIDSSGVAVRYNDSEQFGSLGISGSHLRAGGTTLQLYRSSTQDHIGSVSNSVLLGRESLLNDGMRVAISSTLIGGPISSPPGVVTCSDVLDAAYKRYPNICPP